MCAWKLKRLGYQIKSLITFGSPRVGNQAFAEDFNALMRYSDTIRYVMQDPQKLNDPVTLVPATMGLVHVSKGTQVFCNGCTTALSKHSMDSYRDILHDEAKRDMPNDVCLRFPTASISFLDKR